MVSQGPRSCLEPGFLDPCEVLRATGRGEFGQPPLACHLLTGAEMVVKVLKMVVHNIPVL